MSHIYLSHEVGYNLWATMVVFTAPAIQGFTSASLGVSRYIITIIIRYLPVDIQILPFTRFKSNRRHYPGMVKIRVQIRPKHVEFMLCVILFRSFY